jgi:hypothetical protein
MSAAFCLIEMVAGEGLRAPGARADGGAGPMPVTPASGEPQGCGSPSNPSGFDSAATKKKPRHERGFLPDRNGGEGIKKLV